MWVICIKSQSHPSYLPWCGYLHKPNSAQWHGYRICPLPKQQSVLQGSWSPSFWPSCSLVQMWGWIRKHGSLEERNTNGACSLAFVTRSYRINSMSIKRIRLYVIVHYLPIKTLWWLLDIFMMSWNNKEPWIWRSSTLYRSSSDLSFHVYPRCLSATLYAELHL